MYTASPPGNSRRFSRQPGGRDGAQVPEHAVEHLQLLRDLCQSERLDGPGDPHAPLHPSNLLDRWVLCRAEPPGARRDRRPWRATTCSGRPGPVGRLRGQREQLVCAPEPPPLLGRRPGGAADAVRGAGDGEPSCWRRPTPFVAEELYQNLVVNVQTRPRPTACT